MTEFDDQVVPGRTRPGTGVAGSVGESSSSRIDLRVQLRDITKSFDDFQALANVAFDLRKGEVHALVGENGAGKSTLMRILAGQLAADTGTLAIDGEPHRVDHELSGRRPKVGFVEQEGGLILEMTASENLILLDSHDFWSRTRAAGNALSAAGRRLGHELDLSAAVGTMSFGDRQRVEIALMLAAGAEILVLDEPTACLGPEDAAQLAHTIRTFVADGGSVVYISHKLREVLDLADRITVLRRGQVVVHHSNLASITVEQLGIEMIGEVAGKHLSQEGVELVEIVTAEGHEPVSPISTSTVCSLREVSVAARAPSGPMARREPLHEATLEVRAGEILGVAGVVGSGQQTLAESLVGLVEPDRGRIEREAGPIAYIPEARRRDAIATRLSLADNLVVHEHRKVGRGPFLSRVRVNKHAERLVDRYKVRTPSISVPIGALSGGNQQRAVVGRELDRGPVLVVAHNPFRGLDVNAIRDVEQELTTAAAEGAGVVLLSPDLDEIHRICSRIVVLFAGRVVGEVDPRTTSNEAIGRLMGGVL